QSSGRMRLLFYHDRDSFAGVKRRKDKIRNKRRISQVKTGEILLLWVFISEFLFRSCPGYRLLLFPEE
ncbi:hypothetical protein RFZ44_19020, partial [Acinetobacter sp. 163]|nr:hypothetical protein [Acinetobacter sp. 163]